MSDERLAALERRLRRIEDEREIERMIARYGPLVDAGDAEAVGDLVLQVPTDAGDADGGQITTEFRTISEATSVELVGCTTPSQNRPR